MLARLHQEGGARVARERCRILGVPAILNVGDGPELFNRAAVADYETAALERKLALRLGDHALEIGLVDRDWLHGCLSREASRSVAARQRRARLCLPAKRRRCRK